MAATRRRTGRRDPKPFADGDPRPYATGRKPGGGRIGGAAGIRQRRIDQRDHARDVGIRRLGDNLARPALRRANVIEAARLHFDGHTHTWPGDWREYGDLQCGQYLATASADRRATGTNGAA